MQFHRSVWFDRLVVGAVALGSIVALAVMAFAPGDGRDGVGVVYAPWVSESDALTRAVAAGARFVRYGGLPFIVVVMPEAPGYTARAMASGALFMVDPRALAACFGEGAAKSPAVSES